MRSPWLREDDDHKQQLVSKPGVYDFFDDWSDDIRKDLDQLSMAVDQVLGTGLSILRFLKNSFLR